MITDQSSILRIFLDHLYFSVCCVLVGFFVVYYIAKWTGHGFDLDDSMMVCLAAGVALSLILTAYFTYMSISRRPDKSIIRTKRQE
jgi:hypothetical protein